MKIFYNQLTMFVVMFFVGIFLNPMSVLAYRTNDLYLSLTLIYGGLIMASNMIWSHQIVHFLNHGNMDKKIFISGIILSIFFMVIIRQQLFVDDIQWLKRMIGHHSTAITTTTKLLENKNNFKNNPKIYRLAKDIIYNQEVEIRFMKSFLNEIK
jgi:hypothetical protein